MTVFADPEAQPPIPQFTYSIGLSLKGLPDIIVFGLDSTIADTLITDMALRLLQHPGAANLQTLAPGEPILDLVRDKRAMLLEVSSESGAKHALIASGYAADNSVPLRIWQLVWPDQNGLLPWENGVDPGVAAVQPLLGRSMAH